MGARLLAVTLAALLSFPAITNSQQASTSSTQAATVLNQALAALGGSAAVSDITLTGTAQRIAGSDDETGTCVLKALSTGESRMDLTLPSGNRSEVRAFDTTGVPIGAWSGPDGVQHAIAYHNLLTDSSWFFPALTVQRVVNSTGMLTTYIGQETLNGQLVAHVQVMQPLDNVAGQTAPLLQHLSQMDFFLDPNTLFPVAIAFSSHPDGDASTDIPTQIQFSNYRNVNGVQVPFHVQKFLNNSLWLDMQIQSVNLNSGLSASAFSVQTAQVQ